ncbi:MAG: hypothetical protein HZA64_14130 [Rhodocyclales bacterium]|nr:hypothetical protein [Rhodocyclales bacterium]
MQTTQHRAAMSGPPSPDTVPALEKCHVAAARMACGTLNNFYRIAKRDGLRIVKVGKRASAVVSSDVDAWIVARIANTAPLHTSAMGGRP